MANGDSGVNSYAGSLWTRLAHYNDLDCVARLITSLLTELSEGDETDESAVLAGVSGAMGRPGYEILLGGCGDGKPEGVLTIEPGFAIYAGGLIGTIREIYVAPHLRSKGLGGILIEAATQHAAAASWCRIEVTLPDGPQWSRTRTFYEQNGFSDAGPKLRRVL